MAVTRFQDLIAWQKARVLARDVYLTTRTGQFARDFGLSSQIQRSAVSVMANIAEGFNRNRPAEFQRFLEFSLGSAAEVSSHLYVALDIGYIDQGKFDDLFGQANDVARILNRLRAAAGARSDARQAPPERPRGTRDEGQGTSP